MPKQRERQLVRSWRSWQSHFNSMLSMTFESINKTQLRNERERAKHNAQLAKLRHEEQACKSKNYKQIEATKKELHEMKAYGKVCQHYSLTRLVQAKEKPHRKPQHKAKVVSDSTNADTREVHDDDDGEPIESEQERDVTSEEVTKPSVPAVCPLLSLYSKKTKVVRSSEATKEPEAGKVVRDYRKPWQIKTIAQEKFKRKNYLDRLPEQDCATYIDRTEDTDEYKADKQTIRNNLVRMPSLTTHSMKRLMRTETNKFIATSAPERRRVVKANKLLEKSGFPQLIERSKTTSAIFKDYQKYQSNTMYLTEPETSKPWKMRVRKEQSAFDFQEVLDKMVTRSHTCLYDLPTLKPFNFAALTVSS